VGGMVGYCALKWHRIDTSRRAGGRCHSQRPTSHGKALPCDHYWGLPDAGLDRGHVSAAGRGRYVGAVGQRRAAMTDWPEFADG